MFRNISGVSSVIIRSARLKNDSKHCFWRGWKAAQPVRCPSPTGMDCVAPLSIGPRQGGHRGVSQGRKSHKTAQALIDLSEIAAFYGSASLEVELRFIAAAEAALQRIAENPLIGSPRPFLNPKLRGLRMWPIPEFRSILVFYREFPAGIEVIRVLRASRDIQTLFRTPKKKNRPKAV